jgi:hypothetical protein
VREIVCVMEENVVRTVINMFQKCSYCVIMQSKPLLTAMRIALHKIMLNYTVRVTKYLSVTPHRLSALFGR